MTGGRAFYFIGWGTSTKVPVDWWSNGIYYGTYKDLESVLGN